MSTLYCVYVSVLQHRHLCEFHGLDIEMVINEHYYEVLEVSLRP